MELGFAVGHSLPGNHGDKDYDSGIDNWTFTVNPVPEPATLSLLALGGLVILRRRRSK